MNKHTRAAVRSGAAIIAIGVPSMFTMLRGQRGRHRARVLERPGHRERRGDSGELGTQLLAARDQRRQARPGWAAYVSYTTNAAGDSTTVPAAQCGGQTGWSPAIPCCARADSTGHLVLTYHTPAQLPAQDNAIFTAGNIGELAIDFRPSRHYVYSTVFRFGPSPIAPSGTLGPGTSAQVTLTGEGGLDTGIPNLPVYLSFNQAAGGGSAAVGATQLTSTPTLFTANGSGGDDHLHNSGSPAGKRHRLDHGAGPVVKPDGVQHRFVRLHSRRTGDLGGQLKCHRRRMGSRAFPEP